MQASERAGNAPAMFMVSADVLPMSRYTARLSANAATALESRINGSKLTPLESRSLGYSRKSHGTSRNTKQQGET